MTKLPHLTATIMHNSISRARVLDLGCIPMTQAKRKATAEFGDEQRDYLIVIRTDWNGELVTLAERFVAQGSKWWNRI